MVNKDLRFWSSVMKQKKKLNISGSILQEWNKNEWLLKEMCQTLSGEHIFTMVEFCEDMKFTPCGICSIAVTEKELNDYFYEDRKVKLH